MIHFIFFNTDFKDDQFYPSHFKGTVFINAYACKSI